MKSWPVDRLRGSLLPLILLGLANLVDEFDRQALQVLAPEFKKAFGLSNTEVAAASAAGAVMLALAALPMANLAQRTRRVLLVGGPMLAWAGFVTLAAATPLFWLFILARMGEGWCKSTIEPVGSGLLADYYTGAAQARAFGYFKAASPTGAILGALLAGEVVGLFGTWRAALAVAAILSGVLAVAVLNLPEPPCSTRSTANDGAQANQPTLSYLANMWSAVRTLLRIKSLRQVYLGIGLIVSSVTAVFPIISIYLQDVRRFDVVIRSRLVAAAGLAGILATVAGGALTAQLWRRSPALAVGAPIVGLLLFCGLWPVGVYVPSPSAFIVIFIAGLFCAQLPIAGVSVVLAKVAPEELRESAFAVVMVIPFIVGGPFAAIAVAAVSDATDIRLALCLGAPVAFVGACLLLRAVRRLPDDLPRLYKINDRDKGSEEFA